MFTLIRESSLASFQVKKVQKFLREQHKDDDVQSDEELVQNTRFQVLQNLKASIKEYNVIPLPSSSSSQFYYEAAAKLASQQQSRFNNSHHH